ncbi:hypothetical protein PQ692_10145 [Thermoanaerobacterium thermosaccharolyticum]|uniref:hypothetical protein n=1 Tax=Thermoanaerobacterium thermosaccharolyticum TaxID=1517 RepID=UPI003D2C8B23
MVYINTDLETLNNMLKSNLSNVTPEISKADTVVMSALRREDIDNIEKLNKKVFLITSFDLMEYGKSKGFYTFTLGTPIPDIVDKIKEVDTQKETNNFMPNTSKQVEHETQQIKSNNYKKTDFNSNIHKQTNQMIAINTQQNTQQAEKASNNLKSENCQFDDDVNNIEMLIENMETELIEIKKYIKSQRQGKMENKQLKEQVAQLEQENNNLKKKNEEKEEIISKLKEIIKNF